MQTWPPFVAISTILSDPRHSRRLSCTLVFDITPQPSHTMTLMLYQVSSRNLTLILVLSAAHGRAGASLWT